MRFILRNFHLFVFACFSIMMAYWVANNPERTVKLTRPMVEDAVELQTMTTAAYQELRAISWRRVFDEFVSPYVTAMRMPSLVFERLAERLDKFNEDLSKRAAGTPPTAADRDRLSGEGHRQTDAIASAMP